MSFLPVSLQDMKDEKIKQLDFVYITGDAYVDHPSFGHAVISRVLEVNGYTVGIIPQPDWRDENSVLALGEPRLAFLVMGGNMDSMVNHYSVSKKRRPSDAYSPGGVTGKRPDRAVITYCSLIRKTYKKKPVIIGGIEASLRRMAHYDYWDDRLRRSILLDSTADLLIYGMGEKAMVEVADALDSGIDVKDITFVRGTAFPVKDLSFAPDKIELPSFDDMQKDRLRYAESFRIQYENTDPVRGRTLAEAYPENGVFIVQNPPQEPLSALEMDDVYGLPYERKAHPMYDDAGGVPALDEVRFSITSCRGCFGGCNFCALTFHQGRIVQSRSRESIVKEAEKLTELPGFKGYIHDVGGPTANFRAPSCEKQLKDGVCSDRQCLFPRPCPNIKIDHSDYAGILKEIKELDGVKKVFVRSGIRFDYLLEDKDDTFFEELVEDHISGQLKTAPEHVSDRVLKCMGKPEHSVYERFVKKFERINKKLGKKQYIVPYFMSSHPGSALEDAVMLAEYCRDTEHHPKQVQDFYPTPSTMSTVMYFTGVDPRTMKPVYVPKDPHEKAMQRALLQYRDPSLAPLVREALRRAGREDLIGYGRKCLVRPEKNRKNDIGEKTVIRQRKPGRGNAVKKRETRGSRKRR